MGHALGADRRAEVVAVLPEMQQFAAGVVRDDVALIHERGSIESWLEADEAASTEVRR